MSISNTGSSKWKTLALNTLSFLFKTLSLVNLTIKSFHKKHYRDIFIISVDNLSFGGTGKTTLVMKIAGYLKQAGIKFAVVTRGYKSGYEDMGTYVLSHHRSEDVGDEAVLFKTHFPDADIFMGKNRLKSIKEAIENEDKIIILDDGFQTSGLHKNLKIMLINPEHPYYYLRNFRFLMKREDIVLFYRCPETMPSVDNFFAKGTAYPWVDQKLPVKKDDDSMVLESASTDGDTDNLMRGKGNYGPVYGSYDFETAGFFDIHHKRVEINETTPAIFGFSALGDNFRFKSDLSGFNLKGFIPFKDHHNYTEEDLMELDNMRKDSGAVYLVCTEKDLVKIKQYNLSKIPLIYLQNSIKFNFDFKNRILQQAARQEKNNPQVLD